MVAILVVAPIGNTTVLLLLSLSLELALVLMLVRERTQRPGSAAISPSSEHPALVHLLRRTVPGLRARRPFGIVEEQVRWRIRAEAHRVSVGDHVVLSWNPHCGHCFYCDRDLPILCESYLAHGPKAVAFDGESRTRLKDGRDLQRLMFIGAFAEYAVVADHQAIAMP